MSPETKAAPAPAPVLIADSGSGYGGTARYLAELLPFLDRSRFEVSVVSYSDGPFTETIRRGGWPVEIRPRWRLPFAMPDVYPAPDPSVDLGSWARFTAYSSWQLFVVAPIIAHDLRRRGIRLVHLNNEMRTHLPLLRAARLAGCRTLCHLHGWREFTVLERACAGWVDDFVSVSQAGASYFAEQLLDRPVHAVPNGAMMRCGDDDLRTFRAAKRRELGMTDGDYLTMLAGRLVEWKGHEIYLRALADVRETDPTVRGLIVGHDPSADQTYGHELRSLASSLGLANHVRFLPWTPDVWALYAAADLVVHASTVPEPFGLVVLEAMLAGRPVVATGAGGVLDMVIDGHTGLLVAPGSADDMRRAILRIRADPGLAASLVAQARRLAGDRFTIEQNARSINELYRRALDC